MDVCEKHRIRCADDRRQPCFSTQPLKHHTLPRHSFLALPATGIVAPFAVHLAASAPSARPNVCSVHLPMSTEISAVGGRFLRGAKATICLLWDKHLQTDTKRGPRGSAAKLLCIYLKWLALPCRRRAQTEVARAQAQQYKKSSVHRTGQVSHSSNSISSCYDLSCASQNTKSHATLQSCDGLKIRTFLPKLEANHCRDLEHKQRLIDLDHAESAAALRVCLYTELWKQTGGTAHQNIKTPILFSHIL